jgi:hypothetical protein
VAAAQALPPGKATIRFEFAYDGGGLGKGGKGTLFAGDRGVPDPVQVHGQDHVGHDRARDVNAAEHDEAERARKVAGAKKALADW